MIWKYIQKVLNITCYEDMQINTAMIHPHTPSRVARSQEPVMPSADQDMEQQKPWLTGAGIGSRAVASNESAVSYEATQRLSIPSAHQSSTSPSHWKTYLHKPLHTRVYIRVPLKCGLHMVPSFHISKTTVWTVRK